MQAPQTLTHSLIDDTVVLCRTFPTHATDEADDALFRQFNPRALLSGNDHLIAAAIFCRIERLIGIGESI